MCRQLAVWQNAGGECRIIVVIEGSGELRAGGSALPLRPGAAWLLAAEVGVGECRPERRLTVLECGLP